MSAVGTTANRAYRFEAARPERSVRRRAHFFVCGLPAMYASLCGPREDKVLRDGTALANLGYRTDNVYKL